MKRYLAALALIFIALSSQAQVVIELGQYDNVLNTDLTFRLNKSGTKEGVAYATAYLIPVKDTIVTHFALSDKDGFVEIAEVPQGKYELNVEMLGFKPFRKVFSIKGWEMDLGNIELVEDAEFIAAARVTALADPITIDKDTLIYNAAAFRVGESAVLEDLIKLMPGMAVDDAGNVTVNGEKVDKITVGGKTFFFDDPSMTLKNLPAKFVDKIKVMDKTAKEAELSGMASKDDREKVMDVQLKEEYRQGTFGNVKVLGGASLAKDDPDNMRENPGFLFNTSALFAAYNEKDQVTVLGSGKNATAPGESGSAILITGDEEDEADLMAGRNGIMTSAQAGANYNTSRIKGLTSNLSASYSYSSKDAKERTSRTSFLEGNDNMQSESDFTGIARDNRLVVSGSVEKDDEGDFNFYIRPSMTFTDSERTTDMTSSTSGSDGIVNDSRSGRSYASKKLTFSTSAYAGAGNLGKEGRNIYVSGNLNTASGRGSSSEFSRTDFAAGNVDVRNLLYDRNSGSYSLSGRFGYTEPLTEKLSANIRVSAVFNSFTSDKDAFNGDDGSSNAYYSSYTRRNGSRLVETARLQFAFSEDHNIQAGVSAFHTRSVTESESFGARKTTGDGKWMHNWSPTVVYDLSKGNFSLMAQYDGRTTVPSGENVIPAMDISNPLQITAGNIYLRPSFSHSLYLYSSYRQPKKGFTLQGGASGQMHTSSIVSASWFDSDGVRYSIPVNARKPVSSLYSYLYLSSPLGRARLFNINLSLNYSHSGGTSYQALERIEGFDKDNFNYSEMMDRFWGNEGGDRFYSGLSGFRESRTVNDTYSADLGVMFRKGGFSAGASGAVQNSIGRYSLDNNADMNTWNIGFSGRAGYLTDSGFNFELSGDYRMYRGYADGMNNNYMILNASLSKTIKSLTFSIKCADLLDSSCNLRRNVNAEYREDVIGNTLGRFFLAGISFNFGKMNARNNSAVQNAMIDMAY